MSKPSSRKKEPKRTFSKDALQVTIQKKKETTARAMQIIERMIENTVSENWLLDSIHFISQDQYQDVVEERVIVEQCGYPLCSKEVKNIPTKTYQISTKHNKVYDITDRKNFCSNKCYKASNYLKNQLLTSPLWLRDADDRPEYKILHVNAGGSLGEEVDLGHERVTIDGLETARDNQSKEKSSSLGKRSQKSNENFESSVSYQQLDENSVFDSCISSSIEKISSEKIRSLQASSDERKAEKTDPISEYVVQKKVVQFKLDPKNPKEFVSNISSESVEESPGINMSSETNLSHNKTTNSEKSSQNKSASSKPSIYKEKRHKTKRKEKQDDRKVILIEVVKYIEKCLREWVTFDTLIHIFGEELVKDLLVSKGKSFKECQNLCGTDSSTYEKYLNICKKLNLLELEDAKIDNNLKEKNLELKPLPDYSLLQREAKQLEIKVRSFYQGSTTINFNDAPEVQPNNQEELVILPPVDLHAQKTLRRKIVLDRLTVILPDLVRTLNLSAFNLSSAVRHLTQTFNFSSHNITFKPPEWYFVGMVLVKLISLMDKTLKIMLEDSATEKHLTLLLMNWGLDAGYLDRLVVWLTDIDYLLQKSS